MNKKKRRVTLAPSATKEDSSDSNTGDSTSIIAPSASRASDHGETTNFIAPNNVVSPTATKNKSKVLWTLIRSLALVKQRRMTTLF